jgi:TIR domain
MTKPTRTASGRIFLSYRREETGYAAGWLYDRLNERFSNGQVFKDVDSIKLGEDFIDAIATAVESCDVLLALIGDRWLTITGPDGRRRLDAPEDFVRLEIETALTRDVRVIPILVAGAKMPDAADLPPNLASLVRRQALDLRPNHFKADLGLLLEELNSTLAGTQTKAAWDPSHGGPAPRPPNATLTPALRQLGFTRIQPSTTGTPPPEQRFPRHHGHHSSPQLSAVPDHDEPHGRPRYALRHKHPGTVGSFAMDDSGLDFCSF